MIMSDIIILSIYAIGVIICAALIQFTIPNERLGFLALLWPLLLVVLPGLILLSPVFLGEYIGKRIREYKCK